MTQTKDFQARLCNDIVVEIADSATTSSVADLNGTSLVGILIPAGFNGTAITFQVSSDNETYYNYYNAAGTLVSVTVAASRAVGFQATDFAGFRFLKVVAGTSQTGPSELILQTRPL